MKGYVYFFFCSFFFLQCKSEETIPTKSKAPLEMKVKKTKLPPADLDYIM